MNGNNFLFLHKRSCSFAVQSVCVFSILQNYIQLVDKTVYKEHMKQQRQIGQLEMGTDLVQEEEVEQFRNDDTEVQPPLNVGAIGNYREQSLVDFAKQINGSNVLNSDTTYTATSQFGNLC